MVLLALVVMIEPLLGFIAFASGVTQPYLAIVSMLAVLEAFALLVLAVVSPRVLWGYGRARATRVEVDVSGLSFDGRRVMARAEIANVSTRPADGNLVVVITGHRPLSTVEVSLDDSAAALELARSLDADAGLVSFAVDAEPLLPARKRRILVRAAIAAPAFAALAYVVATKLRAIMPVGLAPVLVAYGYVVLKRTKPARITFGDDGLAIRVDKQAPRFLPFARIRTWVETPRGATIVTDDGEELALRVAGLDASVEAQGETLRRAIDAGCTHRDVAERDEVLEAMLARARLDAREWIAAVRALGSERERGYRHVALSEERLLAVVESPGAISSARAAAALLAVRARASAKDARERIERVAQRSVTPGLRAALLAAAEGPLADHELEVALGELEDFVTPRSAP